MQNHYFRASNSASADHAIVRNVFTGPPV